MATYVDAASGLNFRHTDGFDDSLLVDSGKMDATLDYIKTHRAAKLELNGSWGFKLEDLRFLDGVEHLVKGLDVVENRLNLVGIEKLKNLKYLRLTDELNQPVKFDEFQQLDYCTLDWNQVYSEAIFPASITQLQIGAYKPKFGFNQESLDNLRNITKIKLIQAAISDLFLLNHCGSLIRVDIAYCRSLTDVSALAKHANSLIRLDIENCKKIADFSPFDELIKLQWLNLCGCKSVPSLSFLRNLPEISHCVFYDTVIEDGDLSYLKGIDQVAFNNKAHYSLKSKDFEYKWS
ncbi:hypothetical protein MON38_15455 [Hymenobacter sp. DH14]|uniref:Leucine-rich repeat domain-containing protein n=1 Tax=Hymenobacter cyanobacteriorum TaxID=2926463 RepID=A0A9X1VHP2_9BACT|nr:hypothetical protein [Hymenobacter cyanobacteriorum]MCI1188820.1 hypothetical protein [Hymenobacter cyanobacteriorum]